MSKKEDRRIERGAAEALLGTGISVPWASFRLPFCSKKVVLRATMRRPTMSSQIAIAKAYLDMETTADEIDKMSHDEQMAFMALHGKDVSRLVALCFLRGAFERRFFTRPLSWLLRNTMPVEYMISVILCFVSLLSTDPFLPIIRSAEGMNPLKPRVSQPRKGS